jgi:hypothetical protein
MLLAARALPSVWDKKRKKKFILYFCRKSTQFKIRWMFWQNCKNFPKGSCCLHKGFPESPKIMIMKLTN